MFADPQIRHLQISQSVINSQSTGIPVLTQPLSLSRTPSKLYKAAPLIGEHTDKILNELGYEQSEINHLRENKHI